MAGAATADSIRELLAAAGFEQIALNVRPGSREFIRDWLPGSGVEEYVASASIEAVKPGGPKAEKASCCAPSCCAGEKSA